jgi:glutamate formiminotransferase
MKILMCIPNISEGKNPEIVEQIVDELRRVAGVKILNYSSDPDHHRSVLTYLGEPEPVLEATKAMAAKAIELIDMTQHQGVHPRIGAVDVVPFVPMRGIETEEAVDIARQFGRFLGEQGVPVYYYEEAATRPERVNLATIRKGQYEGLADKLKDPNWTPDEGPAVFNPKTGAIGLDLEEQGIVQVSMNLTNYTKTPIPRVVETIRMEAARHGVSIAGSELIGTMPLGALEEVVKHYLQVHDFDLSQIVEYSLIGE